MGFTFTVIAEDASNATVTGYTGTVAFTTSDHGASTLVPANSTLVNGMGTFGATLTTSGSQTLTATDVTTASLVGHSGPILVSAGTATHYSVVAPGSVQGGNGFSFVVTALDPFNNTATGYTGVVTFTSSDGAATLPGNGGLTNGVGTFSATLATAGNQTITATDTVTASITGSSNAIDVTTFPEGVHLFIPTVTSAQWRRISSHRRQSVD